MTALASTDVTVVVTERGRLGKKRWSRGTITFGNGALTYPSGGVPLPAIAQFGFDRQMDTLKVFGVNERTTDYLVQFGPANRTLLMYVSHDTAGATTLPMDEDNTEAPAARTYSFYATGW